MDFPFSWHFFLAGGGRKPIFCGEDKVSIGSKPVFFWGRVGKQMFFFWRGGGEKAYFFFLWGKQKVERDVTDRIFLN